MTTTKINNRRYLGNKYKLLPFICEVISKECGEFESFADIFADVVYINPPHNSRQYCDTYHLSDYFDNKERPIT